jgi:hypothetical protein
MNTTQGELPMRSLMINIAKIVLRLLAVLLSGVVVAVPGFIAGSMIFAIFGLEFNGRQGYEAGGPIGLILGALIGLIASGTRLFGRRTGK